MRTAHLFAMLVALAISTTLYSQNVWTPLTDFSGAARHDAFSLVLDTDADGKNDRGYIGCGWNNMSSHYKDFWEFNPATGAWTQKADYPGQGTRSLATFGLNGKGYVGAGAYNTSSLSQQLYMYDPGSNQWTAKNNLPGGARWGSKAFVINGTVYYGFGSNSGQVANPSFNKTIYQYNATNDTWTAKDDFPGLGRVLPFVLELDTDNDGQTDRVFVGSGDYSSSLVSSDHYEYLPATDTWAMRTPLPQNATRSVPAYFSIGGKGYVGMGNSGSTYHTDLYEYDPAQDAWTRMNDYPSQGIRSVSNFVLDSAAYVICGMTNQSVVGSVYKYAPFLGQYSEIKGNIIADGNANCTLDGNDFPLANFVVQAQPGPYYTSTDRSGNYTFRVPVGSYTISTNMPPQYNAIFNGLNCPANGSYQVSITTLGTDTSGFDFAYQALQCPRLTVSVASDSRTRCFYNHTTISYCNYGLVDEDSVYVLLTLPGFVSITSSSHTYNSLGNDQYRFYLGTVAAGTCDNISLIDYVSCTDVGLLGAAACSRVSIYPDNACFAPDTAWNGASVEIRANCIEQTDTVKLIVSNTGTADMADSSELRIYLDGTLSYVENFLLAQGANYSLLIPSNGATIVVEADQVTGHPHNTYVATWVERCRVDTPAVPLFTIIPEFPLGDEYEQYDVECIAVSGSFDPNDKQAYPTGVTNDHIIPPGTVINYKLRFQNTGNDTARNVFLVDTLDANFDIATLQLNAASHPYRLEVSGIGQPVLTFYFDSIMLPDSNVNATASSGFVSFSIAPKASSPLGTVVNNFADIYFDFNPPVRTNSVFHTIDNLPVNLLAINDNGVIIILDAPELEGKQQLKFFPNPATSSVSIIATFPPSGQAEVIITDILGRVVIKERFYGAANGSELVSLDISSLTSGMYLIAVNLDGKFSTGKLMKE